MTLVVSFLIVILSLSVYSYSLVDPNITFFNHPVWTNFRNIMVEFGYNRRSDSWNVYLLIIILLFVFNYILASKYKEIIIKPFKLALIIAAILVFSYPFLSADLFSYIFYSRILTLYHHNPYTYLAGDFYLDPWLRFTQWTGNNYPYGPIFLLISAVPSFFGFAKLAPTFLLFKAVPGLFYVLSVWFLEKLNKKWAVIFATSPLIIIEGLVNGHNDLIAISLVIVGIYYLNKKKNILSGIFVFLSIGIKYITLPFLILLTKFKQKNSLTLFAVIAGLIFLTVKSEIQPWYFIMLFGLLPFYKDIILDFNIFYFGLLVSYYPFVRFGGWGKVLYWTTPQKVAYKHYIIIIFFAINLLYLLFRKLQVQFKRR